MVKFFRVILNEGLIYIFLLYCRYRRMQTMACTEDLITFDNDVLRFLNPFTLLKVQSLALNYFCYVLVIYIAISNSVGFWIIITYYPFENLTNYVCLGSVTLLGGTVILISPYVRKEGRRFIKESHAKLRAAHSAGEDVYRQILVDVNNCKKLHSATMFIVLVANLYVMCTKEVRSSFIFFVISDRGFCGDFCWFIEIINFVTLQAINLPLYWFLSVHFYGTQYLTIQLVLLKQHMRKSLEFTRDIHTDDKKMQEKCKKCLEDAIKFHAELKRQSAKCTEIMARIGVIIFLPGINMFIAGVYGIFMSNSMEIKIYLLLLLAVAIWGAFVSGSCGQNVTDESDELLFCFYDCPWYNWNKGNCKTLIIAMSNVMNPMRITFFQLMDIDNTMIVKIVLCSANMFAQLIW